MALVESTIAISLSSSFLAAVVGDLLWTSTAVTNVSILNLDNSINLIFQSLFRLLNLSVHSEPF